MTSLPNSIYLFIPTHYTMISLYPNSPHHDLSISQLTPPWSLFIPTHSTMISLYPNSPHHDLSLSQLWLVLWSHSLSSQGPDLWGKKNKNNKKPVNCSTFPTWIALLIMHTSHFGGRGRLSGHSCDRVGQNFDQHWTVLCSIWPLSFDHTHDSIIWRVQ